MKNKPTVWFLVWLWQTVKHDAVLLYRAFRHPQVSINVKLAMIGVIIYIIAPIDILPDWILGFWLIDDLGVIILVIKRIKKNIPQKLKDELDWKIIVMDKK